MRQFCHLPVVTDGSTCTSLLVAHAFSRHLMGGEALETRSKTDDVFAGTRFNGMPTVCLVTIVKSDGVLFTWNDGETEKKESLMYCKQKKKSKLL